MSKIAVLIPCYNESVTIKKVVEDYKNALPEADIYVYDNNSSDGTDKIASEAGAILRYEYRQGKGNVIRSMFHNVGNKMVRFFINKLFENNIRDIMTGYRAFSRPFCKIISSFIQRF